MTEPLPPLGRRHVLAWMTAPLLASGAGEAYAAATPPAVPPVAVAPVPAVPFPDGVTLLVAGPEGGTLCHWGEAVGAALGQALPASPKVRTNCAGGTDGVTGANQFEARVPPDGTTVLLTPGSAALDWLAGDPRTHFDAGRWVPVMAGITSAIVVAQQGILPLKPGRTVRVAASGPVGPQLPAMLAFDGMGVHMVPVFGLIEQDAAIAAFTAGKVDAVLACGTNVPQQVARLRAAGGQPLFCLGGTSGANTPIRDARFGELPTWAELHQSLHGTAPSGPRYDAYRAVAAATQLEFGLVLSQLTSAAMVALWRRAGEQAITTQSVQMLAKSSAVHPLDGVAAAAATASVAADTAALIDLRGWLSNRLNWRPA